MTVTKYVNIYQRSGWSSHLQGHTNTRTGVGPANNLLKEKSISDCISKAITVDAHTYTAYWLSNTIVSTVTILIHQSCIIKY